MLEEHLHFPDWFLVAAAVPHCYVDIWESRNLDNASGEAMSIAGWRLWGPFRGSLNFPDRDREQDLQVIVVASPPFFLCA